MANTSQKHKEKKSQKRKDRQKRRQEKQQSKAAASKQNSFVVDSMKKMRGTSKSLPGFLAKHSGTICRWLNDYCILFQKADDAYIDYLKLMEIDKRNQLVQDYVDIRVFLSLVQQLKSKSQALDVNDAADAKESSNEDSRSEGAENEEDAQQAMG